MHCPRCGAPSEEGARYCAACGADLPGSRAAKREPRSFGERISALVGKDRKAKLITAATAFALVVAVVAFIALKPAPEEAKEIPRDAYTVAADGICLRAKKDIASSEGRSVADPSGAESAAFRSLVPIVIRWRTELDALTVPPDRTKLAQELDSTLREVEVEISALARVAEEGDQKQTVERAKKVDESTTRVEAAVAALGLSRCARLTLGVAPAASG